VRFEDVRDAAVVMARDVDINRNIAARVDHGALSGGFIAHDIRKMRQPFGFHSFQ
jgi:hypothetical protein